MALACCSSAADERYTPGPGTVSQRLTFGNNRYIGDSDGLFQSEQSLVIARQNGIPVLLAGYVNRRDLNPFTHDNEGLSVSSDVRFQPITWTKRPTLKHDGTLRGTLGDPWLVVNRGVGFGDPLAGTQVYYVALAESEPISGNTENDLAIAHSNDGGQTWIGDPTPITFVSAPCAPGKIDKESAETNADGSRVWIVYECQTQSGANAEIHVVTATNDGVTFGPWEHALVTTTAGRAATAIPSPIVKQDLVDSEAVYVMYEDAAPGRRNLKISSSRTGGRSFDPAVTVLDVPTNDPAFLEENGNRIRANIHFSFEIDPGNNHCAVAYDVDGVLGYAASWDGVVWNDPPPHSVVSQDEINQGWQFHQPMLRGSPWLTAVAAYRQRPSLYGPSTWVRGLVSNDHGYTFNWSDELTICGVAPAGGGPPAYAPCPPYTANFIPCATGSEHFFGDYIGLAPLVNPRDDYSPLSYRFYAAWTDSRDGEGKCSYDNNTFSLNQHTVGQLFGTN